MIKARKQHLVIAFLCAAAWIALVIYKAWVNEDAFITFRVIDNVVNGYGLRWNIIERVQAYTHPLWMLINIPLYAVWGNAFHAAIVMGVLCSMLAAFLLLALCPNWRVQGVVLVMLLLSRSLTEYSTSGLENSLSHLLIALAVVVLSVHNTLRNPALWLSLILALALMTRLDLVFLFLPMVTAPFLFRAVKVHPRQIMLGLLPLALWTVFAVIYYGSPFPNTYYAKLGGTLGADYTAQGLRYWAAYIRNDGMGALCILLAGAVWLWELAKLLLRKSASWEIMGMGCGIASHMAYVIHIGGDYMLGRFFTPDSFAAIALIMLKLCTPMLRLEQCITACVVAAFSYQAFWYAGEPMACWQERGKCRRDADRIMDVWLVAHGTDGLFVWDGRMRRMPENAWSRHGLRLHQRPAPTPLVISNIGQVGYYAGHKTEIVDILGLTDAFLARVPRYKELGLVGHRAKDIPQGYPAAFTGDFSKMDAEMVRLVQFSQTIARGDIWDKGRWHAIYLLNTGWLDEELQHYFRLKG